MTAPVPFDRADMLDRLARETFDVVVVGGGITGVGVALDAAGRGLKTALVERDDFAAGTSSRSSKLAHGGLRYLQQGEFRLVYEALRERQRLLRNAPHLVRVVPFLIPVTKSGGVVGRKTGWALGKAMWLYDLTGGARIGKVHRKITADEAARHFAGAKTDDMAYAYLYYDATVDDARLVVNVARTAAAQGAVMANYCRMTAFHRSDDGVRLDVEAEIGPGLRRSFEVKARLVVNATGVWADQVRTMTEGADPDSIRPAKGIHVTVPWHKVRNDIAVVIPVPGEKRTLFVVPWIPRPDGSFTYTYVGTTDTDYRGPLDDPSCTPDDIAYVLGALNAMLTDPVGRSEITGMWAGLRPLVKAKASARTSDMSRRHSVVDAGDGVVTITGGKLTTFREMAEDTIDHVCKRLDLGRRRSTTAGTPLLGAEGYVASDQYSENAHLDGRYGTERHYIEALVAGDPSLGLPLVPGLPYLRAEAVYACRHEMARTLDDVFSRRTRARLQDRDGTLAAAESVAALIAPELGWDDAGGADQVRAYTDAVITERAAASLPVP